MEYAEYTPRIFDLGDSQHRSELAELKARVTCMQACDTLASQLESLIRTRNPGRLLSPSELARLVDEHVRDRGIGNYGIQTYYPWSNRMVRLLPEAEFIELRTNRNQHKITGPEQLELARKRVGVIGLSVGQSVALTMAMERLFGEIRLADFDTLELTNLNRIRSGVHNIGVPKVVLTAREIAEIDPFIRIKCFLEGITEQNIDTFMTGEGTLDLLVEESDSIDVKFLARSKARTLGIPVVMHSSDPGLIDVERFDLEPDRLILHGLAGDVDHAAVRALTTEEKVSYILKIIPPETMSVRMKASLLEIDSSIVTWPQLASSVVLGGGLAADVSRRILLKQFRSSGRFRVDAETLITDTVSGEAAHGATRQEAADPDEDDRSLVVRYLSSGELEPSTSIPIQAIERIVSDAALAPSGGNCQPWRWIWRDNLLFLLHDRQRSTAFLDFGHLASYLAHGAAIENLSLSAERLGFSLKQRIFPLADDPRLVAAFSLQDRVEQNSPFADLADVIAMRQTNRNLDQRQSIPDSSLQKLRQAAESVQHTQLAWLQTESDLEEIGRILGAIDRLRLLHEESHAQMMDEIRWTPEEAGCRRDGIDIATTGATTVDLAALSVARDWRPMQLLSTWRLGRGLEKMAMRAVAAASVIGLVTVDEDSPRSFLLGGRAMQRLWLMATKLGIGFQPLSPITYLFARFNRNGGEDMPKLMRDELPDIRARFDRLFAAQRGRSKALLFRLAIADPMVQRSYRLPLAEIFTAAIDRNLANH